MGVHYAAKPAEVHNACPTITHIIEFCIAYCSSCCKVMHQCMCAVFHEQCTSVPL